MHRSICTRDVPVWPSYFVPTQLCARWIPENKVERDQFLFSPAAGPAGSTGAGPPFAAISEAIRALSGAQPHWVGAYPPLQPRCFLLLSLLFDRTLMMAHSTIVILTMGPSTIATSTMMPPLMMVLSTFVPLMMVPKMIVLSMIYWRWLGQRPQTLGPPTAWPLMTVLQWQHLQQHGLWWHGLQC